ncbi:MAG: hypothetical protein ACXVCI_02670 [Bdellovibrionota bacterium]
MRLRHKILISVVAQILLFVFVPSLLSRAGLRAANWVHVWEYAGDHEFFSSKARDRVVLLGDSSLGTRYCHVDPALPNAPVDDDCTVRSAMEFQRVDFPNTKKFDFFDFTVNGTLAEAHLYYFLLMLNHHGGGAIKYLIYSLPGKLSLNLHDRAYYVLNEQSSKQIEMLSPALQTDQLRWVERYNQGRLEQFEKEQPLFRARDRITRYREIFLAHRSFVQDILGDFRERYSPDSSEIIFRNYLKKQEYNGGFTPEDRFKGPVVPPQPESFFTEESDFLFLDILSELCRRMGIELVFYLPPNRKVCPPGNLEPCDSKIYQPILNRYRGKNITFLDHRRDPYLVPRDSLDGVHPSLLYKLSIAKEFLSVINTIEDKKPR